MQKGILHSNFATQTNHKIIMNHKIFSILAVLLFSIVFTTARAGNPDDNSTGEGTGVLTPIYGKVPIGRPKAPSNQLIICTYQQGELTVELTIPEGECEIYVVTNTGATVYSSFDSADLVTTIYTGEFSEADITLTTEKGNEYYGTITVH